MWNRRFGGARGGIRDGRVAKQSGRGRLSACGRDSEPDRAAGAWRSRGARGTPFLVPDLTFKDAEGHERKLADWRGRTVLLNLWATWCVPCRKEMPALDALQGDLGSDKFEVVAINIDTRNEEKSLAFLKDTGVKHLAFYADQSAKVFTELKQAGKAFGMPTTLIVDRNGCEIGAMAGPAEWSSPEGVKLVSAAIASPQHP